MISNEHLVESIEFFELSNDEQFSGLSNNEQWPELSGNENVVVDSKKRLDENLVEN